MSRGTRSNWVRDVILAVAITYGALLLTFTLSTLLRLPPAALRGELWVLVAGAVAGLILFGMVSSVWAAMVGIVSAPVIGLAIGFAWTARRFPDIAPTSNLLGLAYIGMVAAVGAAVGLGLRALAHGLGGRTEGLR
jgi:hypothetical protein